MEGIWRSKVPGNRRLEQLQATMNSYIEKNIARVEANLPVFFGHVTATLDKTFPNLDDRAYDDFIDAITGTVINATREAPTAEYFEKILRHAMRGKRRKRERTTLDVIVALRLLDAGNYHLATDYLMRHRNYDGRINAAIAYCYHIQSRAVNGEQGAQSSDMEIRAREEMLYLARSRPPLTRLGVFDRNGTRLHQIIWSMFDLALTWFPSESGLYRIGILQTKHENDLEHRQRLLGHAIKQFPDNKFFLAEAFDTCIELRKGSEAAAIVKQMLQQYPNDHDTLYFGLKLAILGAQPEPYANFRKLAIIKGFPKCPLLLLDTVLEIMCNHKAASYLCFEEAKKIASARDYYITALDYILRDYIDGGEGREIRAKSAFITSVDRYCMRVLKIGEDRL